MTTEKIVGPKFDLDPNAAYPYKLKLRPAIPVSPLIRAARWSALVLGIGWGMWRLHHWSKWHAHVRDMEHDEKIATDIRDAKIKRWFAQEEMKNIVKTIGLEFNDETIALFNMQDLFRADD